MKIASDKILPALPDYSFQQPRGRDIEDIAALSIKGITREVPKAVALNRQLSHRSKLQGGYEVCRQVARKVDHGHDQRHNDTLQAAHSREVRRCCCPRTAKTHGRLNATTRAAARESGSSSPSTSVVPLVGADEMPHDRDSRP